ncbi:MAG: ATPase [Clostridia bacterium]|nr:ATPase [Clostridia bacterium]
MSRLNTKIESLQNQLASLPPGKLIITKYQSRSKWYVNDGNSLTYIPKSKKSYAEDLAKRKYISLKLKELIHEQKALNFYIRHHSTESEAAEKLLSDPHYKALLAPHFEISSQESLDWSKLSFEKSTKYPEQLILKSVSGNIVRSKSEALIDMALYTNKIPFRYECALELDDVTIFPDFTLLHPLTQEIYYWEHFGMMDNPSYAKNAYAKLELYTSYNIIPSINLITTFETKDNPLSSDVIEKTIRYYFS